MRSPYIKIFSIFFLMLLYFSCEHNSKEAVLDAATLYKKKCVLCHGADGKMGLNGAKELPLSKLTVGERIKIIQQGKNLMPSFKEQLSFEQIKAIAEFTMQFK